MKKIPLFILLLLGFYESRSQNNDVWQITYLRKNNGKVPPNQDPIIVLASASGTSVLSEKIIKGESKMPFEISFVDRSDNSLYQIAFFANGKTLMTQDSKALVEQKNELLPETQLILGYTCKKATTVVNSNRIDLWYTEDLKVKGAPSALGQNLGLVLKMVRNGNSETEAVKIEKNTPWAAKNHLPQPNPQRVDALTYKDELWKSRFIQLPVFSHQIINFSDSVHVATETVRFAHGTVIAKKVKFPSVGAGSNVFLELSQYSNGDAYDRTGSVFMIPTQRKLSFLDALQKSVKELPIYENGNGKQYQGVVQTPDYLPVLELMRFFTPFGVRQYNYLQLKNKTWADSTYYRQDISDLLPSYNGQEVWVAVFIGNYDKGGHKVSLNFSVHPNERPTAKQQARIVPLFNTTNVMEMAGQEYGTMFNNEKGLQVTFEVPEGAKNLKLRYITTGHGGWGNGDEFVPKANTISIDGQQIFTITPWRADCGSYRLVNPASGNFNNGLSSSDLSRSNWCPGTVTNPIWIELGNLPAGKHTLKVHIPQGLPEGGSFSAWNVSGALMGEW
jgi:Peptide-N-glycosidase F, N terminal/Peptide-N-glycosidase F, C terminal